MDPAESIAEERIREAMERGEFDNLPGHGKPLPLEERGPFEDPTWWAGFHILKNARLAPAWIVERKELDQAASEARERLERGGDEERFRHEMAAINRRVDDHNLKSPVRSNPMPRFPTDEVIAQVRSCHREG